MKTLFFIPLLLLVFSCSDNDQFSAAEYVVPNQDTRGSGFFEYSDYSPFENKTLEVFYHIPVNANSNSPILFVFHGVGRNASDYRNAMIQKSEQYNFVVIAPKFSTSDFPGGDAYNLGNVFVDGDNPTPSTLNPEDQWTFSVIEPLFAFIKAAIGNSAERYHIFGHSAGGQFAHRFIMFKPEASYDKIIVSAPGWYTVTDLEIDFPYGFKKSPLEAQAFAGVFDKNLHVLVGSLDNDPNASALRRNELADAQGTNRLARAQHFYNKALQASTANNLELNWQLTINEGADHSYELAAFKAADLIFDN